MNFTPVYNLLLILTQFPDKDFSTDNYNIYFIFGNGKNRSGGEKEVETSGADCGFYIRLKDASPPPSLALGAFHSLMGFMQ
jgi:hypothetical protein